MRNIYEVIRQKESEIQQLEKELEALRMAARLLTEDTKVDVEPPRVIPTMRAVAAAAPAVKTDTEVFLSAPLRQFP